MPKKIKTREDVLAYNAKNAGGTRIIPWDGVEMYVPVSEIREAVAMLRGMDDMRQVIIDRLKDYLDQHMPALKRGTASQEVAMNCGADIAIWFANEVIEGRASLDIN